MTIKQQGGIFGRNPTFNDVTVDNDISVTGSITADNAIIAGSETSLQSNITISPQDNYNRTLTIKTDEMEFSAPSSFGANYNAKIQFIPSVLKFYTGNGTSVNEAAKFDGSGNLVFPSGQGIDFSATSGTGTSELFDDYEEGTFSPTFTTSGTDFDSVTYDTQDGFYTKIGNMVNVRLYIRTDAITVGSATGNVRIGGLPFTASNSRNSAAVLSDLYAVNHPSVCQVSGSEILLYYASAAAGDNDNPLAIADLGTGANDNDTIISICYQST